ncbi:unnamed protein product, partial [Iphiclides podalirius]
MSKSLTVKETLDKNLEDLEIQEVLKNGTDLREYALQIDKGIKEAERNSVADYLRESENIVSLHNQIEECDGILARMESMLSVFQNDLGSISNEIISLQKRSVNMSVQLSNRQALKGPLSSFIEDMAVSETLIFGINNVPVTDKEFMVQLAILNQKLNFVKEQDFKETKACHDQKTKYPYEALFRSLQYALVDNSCREYLFTTEFFHVKATHAQELFDRILGKTLSLLVKNVENYVLECYDCLALFLCIQLINRYKWMCHKRAVAALDSYWDSLLSALYPRLEYVFKLNIQSVRDCDPAKLSNKELGPHYITRRYAEFSAAMLSLNGSY